MRHIFFIVVIFFLSFSILEADTQGTLGLEKFYMLKWKTDLGSAFQQATKENKNLVIMVEDTHCKWCIKMKRGALSNVDVQKILKNYILVKIQRSNSSDVKQLNGFDGTIPNLYFITKEKEIVENIVGYYRADDFLEYIQEIQSDGF